MPQDQPRHPQVFISHRHSDKKVADLVRQWIEQTTACRVKVFQSSSYAHGPKIGKPLSQELRDSLWRTDVLLLVYTLSDLDWSYCMWECGVATDPASPDTRVVVLQFSDEGPAVFDDQVRVNARSKESLMQFASQLLTDTDFFPRRIGAITGFAAESPQLQTAAMTLFEALSAIPPTKHEKIEEWPAWPFFRLRISLETAKEITDQPFANARERLLDETKIAYADSVACSVLGVRKIAPGSPLNELIRNWAAREPAQSTDWVESVLSQLHLAAKWEFTDLNWSMLKGKRASAGEWFSPVLAWVRRIPYHNSMEFDLYLLPFTVHDGETHVVLPVPAQGET